MAAVGLVCIVAPVFVFSADTSFPGWRAGFPTGGALLLIAAGPDAFVNRDVLATRMMVWIGLISYPLYLWHWPLLSFATLSLGTLTTTVRVAIIGASIVFAWVTYRIIERPVRVVWPSAVPIVTLCALMTVTGVIGYAVFTAEGFYDRPLNRSDKAHFLQYYERMRTRGLAEAYRAECDFMDWSTEQTRSAISNDCTQPGDRATVFLWGDSHAQALSLGIRRTLPAGVRLAQVTTSGCPPRLRERDALALEGRCAKANAYARERIAALKPKLVVLAQILAHDQTDWLEMARVLRQLGVQKTVLVGPAPQWLPNLPLVVVTNHWGQAFDRVSLGLNQELFQTDATLRERFGNSDDLTYVSLLGSLCDGNGCLATVPATDNQLMTADIGHLTPAASTFVGRTILASHLMDQ
jgi:hypothetical protein